MQKDSLATREEMWEIKEQFDWKKERFRLLSDKGDKNRMADAEMEAELQGLQAGEERRGSNASQTGDGCMEALWQQFIALGANGIETFVQRLPREMGAAQGQMPRREEGRRNSKDEQGQGRNSQQLVLSAPGGINEGAPASSLELDLHRVRGAPGEGGGAGKSGAQGDRKRGPTRSPGHPSMEEDDAKERTQELLRKTVRKGIPVPLKETASERTQGPLKEIARVRTQGPW